MLAGCAASVALIGAALAQPAIIFELGGKNDKSFGQAAWEGAERWKKASGKPYLEYEIANAAQREQAARRFAESAEMLLKEAAEAAHADPEHAHASGVSSPTESTHASGVSSPTESSRSLAAWHERLREVTLMTSDDL